MVNIVKRVFLIWIFVILFGNSVIFFSGFGIIIVTVGVFLYIKVKEYDYNRREFRDYYLRDLDLIYKEV